jgi:hypothetical protein
MAPTYRLEDGTENGGPALKGTESHSNLITSAHLYTLSFVHERRSALAQNTCNRTVTA